MKLRSSLAFALFALFASLPLSACSPADSAPADGETDAAEEEVHASCTNPRRYFVAAGDEGCQEIAGRRGKWIPEALFEDAPVEVQTSTCAYRWLGERYSRPDRDALVSRLGWQNGIAPACGSGSQPNIGDVQEIPGLDVLSQAGSVGCDVCGILKKDRIWVVLPPDKIDLRQFEVRLSDGSSRAFEIDASAARALSLKLPPPPAGLTYRAGRVHVY